MNYTCDRDCDRPARILMGPEDAPLGLCVLHLSEFLDTVREKTHALTADNARLRAALEKYADETNWGTRPGRLNTEHDVWEGEEYDGWTVARAALGKATGEP